MRLAEITTPGLEVYWAGSSKSYSELSGCLTQGVPRGVPRGAGHDASFHRSPSCQGRKPTGVPPTEARTIRHPGSIGQGAGPLGTGGIVERIKTSEWAAPIVPVPKKNGRIRLCGDYKVTVMPHLNVDQYPLPKPEDLFASLAGGQRFTVLDLSHPTSRCHWRKIHVSL